MAIMPLMPPEGYARMAKVANAGGRNLMFETSYGPIEAALMMTHRIPARSLSAFRGRLAFLQKQRLLGAANQVGKGHALRYGPDELHRLIFATELLEFGVGPAITLKIVAKVWRSHLAKIFDDAEHAAEREAGPNDVVLHLSGVRLLADALADSIPNVGACRLAKLADLMDLSMQMGPDDALPPRVMAVNLSQRLRSFHRHFAGTYMSELRAETNKARRNKPK
jgi:hypothetical protein